MDHKNTHRLKIIFWQLVKFHFVGITNVLITYGIYSLVVYLYASHRMALIADYAFGIIYTFVLNKFFTFNKAQSGRGWQEFARIILVYGCVFMLNWFLLNYFVENLDWNKYLAQLFSLAIVTVLSFFGQKFIVFREGA